MIVLALLALIPPLLTGPAAAALSIALLKRGRRRVLFVFWMILACVTVLLGILIAHTFGDFFPGLGCFATLWTPAAIVLTILVWWLERKRLKSAADSGARPPRLLLATLLVLIALQLSAPLIALGYAQSCAHLNRRAAQPIIHALDTYSQNLRHYPWIEGRRQADVQMLRPYLETVPPLACRLPTDRLDAYSRDADWSLYFCQGEGKETLLLVPLIGTDSVQIYNTRSREWTRGNAFDGYCP